MDDISMEEVFDENDSSLLLPETSTDRVDFCNYPKISFLNLKVHCDGIYDGIYNILSSSIMILKAPNKTKNLNFRLPTSAEWSNVSCRKEFQKVMIPTVTVELFCELSKLFQLETTFSFNVKVKTNSVTRLKQLKSFVLQMETTFNDFLEFQQKYSNSLWIIRSQSGETPSELQLKCDDSTLKTKYALIFCKTSAFDTSKFYNDITLPNKESDNDQKIIMNITAYACSTSENEHTIKSIIESGTAVMSFLTQATQFLKCMKVLSIPDRPANIPDFEDYNLSPIIDAIIKPTIFDFTFCRSGDSIKRKFSRFMKSEKIGLMVIEGAPGTGKTTTAVATISDYIDHRINRSRSVPRILVTAPSNAAADVLYTKLRNRLSEITICRIGENSRFKKEVSNQSKFDFEEFTKREFSKRGKDVSKSELLKEFILSATIIIVTLGSSQTSDLVNLNNRLQFDLLVVDECGQSKLDEFLFPFHFTSIRKILLIGDPRQLGPTLKSSLMLSLPSEQTSIFVKLCNYLQENSQQTIIRLREQHRMRPFVASMVSHISYTDNDRITTASDGKWNNTANHPALLVFSGESWNEERTADSFSYESKKEAEFGLALIKASLKRQEYDFRGKHFPRDKDLSYAVISLYKGQVNLFNRLLKQTGLENIVKVYTVDQMQGSECDIAIVSAVRASKEHLSVGFASDLRRLNVALSRAACVYILAKYDDFKLHQGWSKLFHEAIRKDCLYADADEIQAQNYIYEILENHSKDRLWMEVPK